MLKKFHDSKLWLNTIASLILIGILMMYLLPMFKFAATAYLATDGRWWINQYFEYYNTFPYHGKVAFSGFNQTGLALNSFYPTLPLRWLETPFVLLHVQNIYILFGSISIIITATSFIALYLITKTIGSKNNYFTASMALLIHTAIINPGFSNSLPQYLANTFVLFGVYGLISKKHWILFPTTFGILTTSFATSITACFIYLCVMLASSQNLKDWLKDAFYGIIGLLIALPTILPALMHIKDVMSPTKEFMPTTRNFFFTSYFHTHGIATAVPITVRVIITAAIFALGVLAYKKLSNKAWLWIAFFYLLTMLFPYFSGFLSAPVQAGTWIRTWPLVSIMYIYLSQKSSKCINYTSAVIIVFAAMTTYLIGVNYDKVDELQPSTFSKALKKDDLKQVSQNMSSDVLLKNKKGKTVLKGTSEHIARVSPDYIPAKATLIDRDLAFLPQKQLYKNYGVQKTIVKNNPNAIKLQVNPILDSTPLAVWHYDFFKYHVTSSAGQVEATNHGTFEYHGKSPAMITIEVVG